MNKLKTIIDLVNQGDKAKLWKYLNKGIYSKKDKIDAVKEINNKQNNSTGNNSVQSILENNYMTIVIDYDKLLEVDGEECYFLGHLLCTKIFYNTNSVLGNFAENDNNITTTDGEYELIRPLYIIKNNIMERVEKIKTISRLNTSDYATYYDVKLYTKTKIYKIEQDLDHKIFSTYVENL